MVVLVESLRWTRAVESLLWTLAPRTFVFGGVEVVISAPADKIEEVEALRLLKLRLC